MASDKIYEAFSTLQHHGSLVADALYHLYHLLADISRYHLFQTPCNQIGTTGPAVLRQIQVQKEGSAKNLKFRLNY